MWMMEISGEGWGWVGPKRNGSIKFSPFTKSQRSMCLFDWAVTNTNKCRCPAWPVERERKRIFFSFIIFERKKLKMVSSGWLGDFPPTSGWHFFQFHSHPSAFIHIRNTFYTHVLHTFDFLFFSCFEEKLPGSPIKVLDTSYLKIRDLWWMNYCEDLSLPCFEDQPMNEKYRKIILSM